VTKIPGHGSHWLHILKDKLKMIYKREKKILGAILDLPTK
jgi:hypothetical protein